MHYADLMQRRGFHTQWTPNELMLEELPAWKLSTSIGQGKWSLAGIPSAVGFLWDHTELCFGLLLFLTKADKGSPFQKLEEL